MQRLSKKYFASNLYKTQVVQVQHVSAFVFFLVPFVPLCVSRHFIFESCTAHGASLLGSTEPIAYDCIYRFRLQTQSIGKETSNVCPAREYRSVSKLENNHYIVHEYLTHRNQFPIIHLLSIFFSFFNNSSIMIIEDEDISINPSFIIIQYTSELLIRCAG